MKLQNPFDHLRFQISDIFSLRIMLEHGGRFDLFGGSRIFTPYESHQLWWILHMSTQLENCIHLDIPNMTQTSRGKT